jgi:hypothetical protein
MYNCEIEPINSAPIAVDYNHTDAHGGILLDARGSVASIQQLNLVLDEGQIVWISDRDLDYLAVIVHRDESWVAVPISSTRREVS